MISNKKKDKLINLIYEQLNYLYNVRAFFPYIDDTLIGKNKFVTPPFYLQKLGFNFEFVSQTNLTSNDINKINSIAHWINQNFIVRVYSLLEEFIVISPNKDNSIDKNVDGWEEVDLIRRLRNKFAHSSGKYNPEDEDSKKLYERIVPKFDLKDLKSSSEASEFPLSIDKVLKPLVDGCKKYIKNHNFNF